MRKPLPLFVIVGVAVLCGTTALLAQAPAVQSARTWVDRTAEIEAFLKSAEVVDKKELGVGVTRPWRAKLVSGGPIDEMVWKPIRPGRYSGYWESYKSEIAAYELDKYFGLQMTPPTVERRLQGEVGAAVMWVSPTKSFKDLGGVPGQGRVPGPPPAQVAAWMRQITRAKMFDNLVGNTDPNLGNWLVDPAWNLILIDKTRAFTSTRNLYHQLNAIDGELWAKMEALDEPTLKTVVGAWLDSSAIRSILERRDRMKQVVAKLSK